MLADAERKGLWEGTPFESAEAFAVFVGSPEGREDATREVLELAARTVRARGRDPAASDSEVIDVANGLSRYLVVAGLGQQTASAGRN